MHIWQAFSSGLKSPERVVVTDSTAWAGWWARIMSNRVTPIALPAVNFVESRVGIVVGPAPGALGTLRVRRIVVERDTVRVHLAQLQRAATCAGVTGGTVEVHTVDVVLLPARPAPVAFHDYVEIVPCND